MLLPMKALLLEGALTADLTAALGLHCAMLAIANESFRLKGLRAGGEAGARPTRRQKYNIKYA
jgi:hypothetical protein